MSVRLSTFTCAFALTLVLLSLPALAAERPDPELFIPRCRQAPVLDGKLSPGEWQFAAATSMLEAYPIYEPRSMRKEQAVFYVSYDPQYLYIAMESFDSNTDTIIAACSTHDDTGLFGGDALELMVAPASGKEVEKYDFAMYYLGVNAIGTVWDAKMVPRLAENHGYWESGLQMANSVDGTHWVAEIRLPLKSISNTLLKDGTRWRLNFVRTFPGYSAWTGWSTTGGASLNDPKVGGDVTFDSRTAAVRLLSVDTLATGKLGVKMEVANGTAKAQKVKLTLRCTGQKEKEVPVPVGADEQEVTVKPGEVLPVTLGKDEALMPTNDVTLEAVDQDGRRLFFIQRRVDTPVLTMKKRPAPKVPLVSIFPRFLPSLERLAVVVDYTAWAIKNNYTGNGVKADIAVFPKGKETGKPVLSGAFADFTNRRGTWRQSTRDLPEGEYVVKVKVTAPTGEVLEDYDDWFEKRIFDWMVHPRGVGEAVPAPYLPLEVAGSEVRPWGRGYRFAPTGLPAAVTTQGRQVLAGETQLLAEIDRKPVSLKVATPFAFTEKKPGIVGGTSTLTGGNLEVKIDSTTEYDGFTLFRVTYGPRAGAVNLTRMRLRLPIDVKYAKFYSAAGDSAGTTILGDVLPQKEGRVYDSFNNTRSVVCSPTFATLFWVADHDISFCYAADSDRGWLIRDDAPAVEAYRQGKELVLWLNFVDKPFTLTGPRTLEFALQAGPTKPRPEGWRGIQNLTNNGADPNDAPLTIIQVGGSGETMAGGTHLVHPGDTEEMQQKSRERLARALGGPGNKVVVGYNFWGNIPKGRPEARVFRGEWGVTKQQWDATTEVREWEWKNRFYGENKDLYTILGVRAVPSYVDFLTYGLDEAFKHTQLAGHYDDVGYPHPVYDEELGLGFIREDGRKIYSSGLWIYRERWKRAAYTAFLNNKPNYLEDSQHVHAHFMPAYGFIGLWTPCEHGYYNPFKGQDNLDFYRTIDRYAAFNPAKQFGQVPMVGMSSPEGWGGQGDPAVFARDTRCMMMLAMLNDHDVGSFGAREPKTVIGLRHARNLFKPWEKEVSFIGYWESAQYIRSSHKDMLVAAYRRPDSLLLIIGNVGDKETTAVITPDWKKLALDPKTLQATNAETGEAIPVTDCKVTLARHDLRLILVQPKE